MNPDSLQIQQPDSVAQLAADLHLGPLQEPPAVPFTFDTIGWPILAAVIGISLLILAFFQIRKYRRNRYRREALKELQRVEKGELELIQNFVILKRTAIHAFGREAVGRLAGTEWLKFLEDHARGVRFLDFETEIDALIYKNEEPPVDTRSKLVINTQKWIRYHAAR